jgi:hypothetical protein
MLSLWAMSLHGLRNRSLHALKMFYTKIENGNLYVMDQI